MPLDLIQTLSDLVALPSVNPMGRNLDGPEFYEHRVTDYLEALFRRLGVPYKRQTVEPRRDNIVARLDGRTPATEGGKLIMFEAHQDTVPVDGMTIDPFTPTIRAGRIYGRGSCDIKGGLAAMLAAFARLAEERPADMPTILMACTVNEEHGHTGAAALANDWEQPGTIFPRRPDAAVIAEPTGLQVVVAHKGVARWRCRTRGRAAHSSQPHLGDNAIFRMTRVLAALERYAREQTRKLPAHPLCGVLTVSVGLISGGISVNTVPDVCTIDIDRRVVPGEDPLAAQRHIIDYVAAETGGDPAVEHEPPYLFGAGLSDDINGPLAAQMVAAAGAAGIASSALGVPYGTNASTYGLAGVPSIVFGPGSIDQAHTADEWLALDQLAQASDALYQYGRA